MTVRWKLLRLVFGIPALVLSLRCSIGPMGAGGTETGNPELSACAQELFTILDSRDAWLPHTYIPGGIERLDPLSIYSAPADTNPRLAKSASVQTDSAQTMIRTDTISITDTIVLRRVLFIPRTTYLSDTLVNARFVADTLWSRTPTDTVMIVSTRHVVDSIIVHDTIVMVDSIVYYDTLHASYIVENPASPNETIRKDGGVAPIQDVLTPDTVYPSPSFVAPVYSESAGLEYLFLMPSAENVTYPVASANYRIVSNPGALASAARNYSTIAGATVREEFIDLDGDGLLLTAAPSVAVGVRFTMWLSSGFGAESTLVEYEAGEDRNLSNTAASRIRKLLLTRTASRGTDEFLFLSGPGDSAVSSRISHRVSGPIRTRQTRYRLLERHSASQQMLDLCALETRWSYRLGGIDEVRANVTITDPVSPGLHPSRATVRFFCDLRTGSIGEFTGEVDTETGLLAGTYEKDGKQYRVTVTRDGTVIQE